MKIYNGTMKTTLLLVSAVVLISGCGQTVQVGQPLTDQFAGDDIDARMEFWHSLSERTVASNDEAFHAVLLFFDGQDTSADYGERVATLKERGMLPADFDEPAAAAIRRGTLASTIVGGLEIEGGLVMQLVGPVPRYASRELQYLGLYPAGSDQQVLTGADLIDAVAKVEDYQRRENPELAAQVARVQFESAYQAQASRVVMGPAEMPLPTPSPRRSAGSTAGE